MSLNKLSKIQNVQITDIEELTFTSDTEAASYDVSNLYEKITLAATLSNGYTEKDLKYSDFKSNSTDKNLIEITKTVDKDSSNVIFVFTKDGSEIYSYDTNYSFGNIAINGITYQKAALVPVNFEEVTITGSDSNKITIDNIEYLGVFIEGRNVTLSPYAIGKYEVTQQLFEAVMGTETTYEEAQELLPIRGINWYHAIAFCNKLTLATGGTTDDLVYTVTEITDWENLAYTDIPTDSSDTWNATTVDLTKKGYRLPTEAEWEFAARGGNPNDTTNWRYTYAGSDIVGDVAWYSENSDSKTHEVGLKIPNALGLYDMSGNVWEWCYDWYGDISADTSNTGVESGSNRIFRGGGWGDTDLWTSAVTFRLRREPNNVYGSGGFRLARTL